MAELRIGEARYPAVMTVGVMDAMALKGYSMNRIPEFYTYEKDSLDWEAAVSNGMDFLMMLLDAGQESARIRNGKEPQELPDAELLRMMLTPGQIWGLCEAAIFDSLRRTVEAAPEKNESPQ